MTENRTLYDKNISFFKESFPDFYSLLDKLEIKKSTVFNSKRGHLTLTYKSGENDYFIHSKYDPEKESIKLCDSIDLNTNHIIVFGIGLGYLLKQLLIKKPPFTRLMFIEPELEFVKHSLHTINWYELLRRNDVFFVFGANFNEIANRVHDFISITVFEKLEWVELSSEVRLLKPFFEKAKAIIDSEVKTNLLDFKTLLAENYLVPRNIINNIPFILKSKTVISLKDRFENISGIIVSAGPSLDKNISYLKQIRNRAIIICVDTALKPLLSHGIQPHFIAIADPSYKNYLHLQGLENSVENFIIAETGISTQIFRDFSKQIFTASIGKPLVSIIEKNSTEFGEFEAWGSVISFAMNFGIYMGLNPIVFVGQDFAFSNMRNHCRKTSWEETKIVYSSNMEDLQRFEKNSIGGNRKIIEIEDIYGNKTYTSERLMLYKNYLVREISKRIDISFINASEGGILTEIPHMSLQEVIKKYIFGRKKIDINRIKAIDTIDKSINIKKLIVFFNSKIKFYKNYKNKANSLVKEFEKDSNLSNQTLLEMVKRAEEVKNILYAVPENGDIVEMWSKAPIFHLLKSLKNIEMNFKQLDRAYLLENSKTFKTYFTSIEPVLIDIIDHFKGAVKKIKELSTIK